MTEPEEGWTAISDAYVLDEQTVAVLDSGDNTLCVRKLDDLRINETDKELTLRIGKDKYEYEEFRVPADFDVSKIDELSLADFIKLFF